MLDKIAGTICVQIWRCLKPAAIDVAHTLAQHIPTVNRDTVEGDNQHIWRHCGDAYAHVADWADHAIAETSRENDEP